MPTAYIMVILHTMCDLLFSNQIQGIIIYSDKEQCTTAKKKKDKYLSSQPLTYKPAYQVVSLI